MRVFLAKDLRERLGAAGSALVADFKEWRQRADLCDHYQFGRLTPEKMPPAHDFEALWHVHLLPPDGTQSRRDWVTKWNFSDPRFTRARCNRTSDRLLFFAEHDGDWLLLTIGDHSVFANKRHQEKWADVTDRWVASMQRSVREDVELFEMPREINATEFNLDDVKVNRRVTHDFTNDGEKIEDIGEGLSLWQRGNRIALVVDDQGRPRKIIYFVQWKDIFHKFVGHKAISQVAVWADALDPRSRGIASQIFWDHLLPIHNVLMTDALQTPDGKRFWRNRVAEAFARDLRVYYLNLLPSEPGVHRELVQIKGMQHFADLAAEMQFWGLAELHQARKIIISDIKL